MNINYMLKGVDENGNVVMELPLTATRAAEILVEEVHEGRVELKLAGSDGSTIEIANLGRNKDGSPKKKYGCTKCGKPGHRSKTCSKGLTPKIQSDSIAGRHSEGKPCCGSFGPLHKKGCKNYGVVLPPKERNSHTVDQYEEDETQTNDPERANKKREVLSLSEFHRIKENMHEGDFSSASYALVNKLPPREVNKMVLAADYEAYCNDLS